ncbi:hypothetical protein Lepto7375DRAFT_7300 [Leptolyngbya sp. PCC 7375]|nr:hypothetical protein Lepto7375DRAFT_7300 [Leptolyngbya sp. PCC 7375]
MADQKQKPLKIVFGDPNSGNVRVMMGNEEIPNIRSVALLKTEPGEIPIIEIKMLVPELTIEDYTDSAIHEMKEVSLDLSKPKKVEPALPKATLKAKK